MAGRRRQTQSGKMGQIAFGRARFGEKSSSKWKGIYLVQEVFGFCTAKTGTQIDESMQAGENGHER